MENEFRLSFGLAVEVEARVERHQKAISVAIVVVEHGVAKSGPIACCLASRERGKRPSAGLRQGAASCTPFHQRRNGLLRDHASFGHGRPPDSNALEEPGERQFSWFRRASGQGWPRKSVARNNLARLAWLDH
jgi:hypothetical protein